MESMLTDSKWLFGRVKCFVVSMYVNRLLASPTVSKQGQVKAIWGETKSQEVMVHFSGISFARMYGEHMRSRFGAIAVNLYSGNEIKLFLFVCF